MRRIQKAPLMPAPPLPSPRAPPPRARGAGLHARAAAQIDKRLEDEGYAAPEAFAEDMRLVFRNCIAYNPPEVRPTSEMTRCMRVAEATRPRAHALPRRAVR